MIKKRDAQKRVNVVSRWYQRVLLGPRVSNVARNVASRLSYHHDTQLVPRQNADTTLIPRYRLHSISGDIVPLNCLRF
jgi:hypothetical protein